MVTYDSARIFPFNAPPALGVTLVLVLYEIQYLKRT